MDRRDGAAGASDGAGGGGDGASARPLVDRRGERRGEGACRGGGGGGGDGDGASARPRVDRRGERRGDGAAAGASAAGARPRVLRRRAPAPANALQPLSMCWPMTDKATVASHIGQRAQPSSSPPLPLRGAALRGVSSIWNDLSACGSILIAFSPPEAIDGIFYSSERSLRYSRSPDVATTQLKYHSSLNSSGGVTLAIMDGGVEEKAVR